MKSLPLLALVVVGGCMSKEDRPTAHSISCPSQLVLTGGPYAVNCTIEYEPNGYVINMVLLDARDSSGSDWISSNVIPTHDSEHQTLVVTSTQTTAPGLGELTIAATLLNYSNDVSPMETRSNSVSTTMMVVAP